MDPRQLPTTRPHLFVAELRRPQVVLGVAVWSGLLAVLLTLSAVA
jgi:hypothetical protein